MELRAGAAGSSVDFSPLELVQRFEQQFPQYRGEGLPQVRSTTTASNVRKRYHAPADPAHASRHRMPPNTDA